MRKPPELLTVAEVAEAVRVSRSTVIGWIRDGHLPALRVGPRVIRIRQADLEEFLGPEPTSVAL